MIARLINEGSYFGAFFLHTVHGEVSHLRGLRRTYKTFIKKSRATPVPHSIIAVDGQNLLLCLYFYILDLCEEQCGGIKHI